MEQGFHFEGSSKNQKLTWLFGVRSKTNKNLLSSQEVKGNYIPSAADLQALLLINFHKNCNLNCWEFFPVPNLLYSRICAKIHCVFSPLFTANLGLDIFFDGQEKDNYNNNIVGFSLDQTVNKKVKLKWMASHYDDNENENFDITGAYLFGERDFDKTKPTFG